MRTEGLTAARLDRIHHLMAGYVERGEVPGLVSAVSHRGDVRVEAIGKQSIDGAPIQRDTIFRISSMTKPVTAVAAMILVEEGRLRLDEPVDDFLPELANRRVLRRIDATLDDTVPAKRPITTRDLLTSRMGFGIVLAPPDTYPIQRAVEKLDLGQGPPNPSVPPEPDEWMRRLGTLPLIDQPGVKWLYNTSSDVLGVLIARVARQPFEQFLSERLFEPLGMKDTGFSVPLSKINRLATSYEPDQQSGTLEVYDAAAGGQWSHPPAFPSGAGGLVSTAADYLIFAHMLLNRGVHGSTRILSEPSIQVMTTNHLTDEQKQGAEPILDANQGWGFGVSVVTGSNEFGASIGSYGWAGGLGTIWTTDPATQTVAILLTQVNFTSPAHPAVVGDFLRATFDPANT